MQNLYYQESWKGQPNLQSIEEENTYRHNVRTAGNPWSKKEGLPRFLPTCTETAFSSKTNSPDDILMLQKCWLCPHDRGRTRAGVLAIQESVCPCGVLNKSLLPCSTQNVDLVETSFGNFHGISQVCTHIVGSKTTDNILVDKLSVTRFFQTKANPSSLWTACAYELQFNL